MNFAAILALIAQLAPLVKEYGPGAINAIMAIWNKPGLTEEEFLAYVKMAKKSYEDHVPSTQLPKP